MMNMKSFLKTNNKDLPNLFWDMVFIEATYPLLFTCVDNNDGLYICACFKSGIQQREWIIAKTTPAHVINLLRNEVTIHEMFSFDDSRLFVGTLRRGDSLPQISECNSKTIPPEILPTPGYYLEADPQEFAAEIEELQTRAKKRTVRFGTDMYIATIPTAVSIMMPRRDSIARKAGWKSPQRQTLVTVGG